MSEKFDCEVCGGQGSVEYIEDTYKYQHYHSVWDTEVKFSEYFQCSICNAKYYATCTCDGDIDLELEKPDKVEVSGKDMTELFDEIYQVELSFPRFNKMIINQINKNYSAIIVLR